MNFSPPALQIWPLSPLSKVLYGKEGEMQNAAHRGRQENMPITPSSYPECTENFTSETNALFFQAIENQLKAPGAQAFPT